MDSRSEGRESSLYASLLKLEERSRHAASFDELASIIINETNQLVPYQKAALWLESGGVSTLGGFSEADRSTPLMLWLERVFSLVSDQSNPAVIAGPDALTGEDREEWALWLPAHAIWIALTAPDGTRHGALMCAREEPWSSADVILLSHAAVSYGSTLAWLNQPGRFRAWRKLRRSAKWLWRWR